MRAVVNMVLFLATMVLAASAVLAQQIQGQVRYAPANQPALGALVRCDGTGGISTQVTDRNGKFYFRVSPGHYTVTVRVPGFREEQQSRDMIDTQQSEYLFFTLTAENPTSTGAKPSVVSANVPVEAQSEFEKAEAAFAGDKKDKAQEGISHLEKAIAIDPKFLEAQLRLGVAFMDLQQWEKAEQALKKTLEIDPKTVNASFALGEVYLHEKKYDQAESVLQQGMSIETRSARAHLTLARVFWERVAGVKDEAQWRPALEKSYQEVKQALDLEPNLADAHLLKGNLYFKVRRAEDALHEFDEYLRLDPKGQFAEQTRTLADKIRKALAEQKP